MPELPLDRVDQGRVVPTPDEVHIWQKPQDRTRLYKSLGHQTQPVRPNPSDQHGRWFNNCETLCDLCKNRTSAN